MPYGPFDQPLDQLISDDIDRLIADGPPESLFLELKQDLSVEGETTSRWAQGETKRVPDAARDKIGKEICAFANADGGTLIIGLSETKTPGVPGRPEAICPLPDPAKLADQLRRALGDLIEPPLGRLEAFGIATEANGAGVVVLRVAPSMLAPHRVKGKLWQCFVRREDESKLMSMREIQDMVLQREAEAVRFERHFEQELNTFRDQLRGDPPDQLVLGWHLMLAPRTHVSMSLTKNYSFSVNHGLLKATGRSDGARDWSRSGGTPSADRAKPILGGLGISQIYPSNAPGGDEIDARIRWLSDGGWQLRASHRWMDAQDARMFPTFFTLFLADAFRWMLEVRARSMQPALAFAVQTAIANPARVPLESNDIWHDIIGQPHENGVQVSPLYEFGAGDSFDDAVDAICHDIFNSFGASFEGLRFSYETL